MVRDFHQRSTGSFDSPSRRWIPRSFSNPLKTDFKHQTLEVHAEETGFRRTCDYRALSPTCVMHRRVQSLQISQQCNLYIRPAGSWESSPTYLKQLYSNWSVVRPMSPTVIPVFTYVEATMYWHTCSHYESFQSPSDFWPPFPRSQLLPRNTPNTASILKSQKASE